QAAHRGGEGRQRWRAQTVARSAGRDCGATEVIQAGSNDPSCEHRGRDSAPEARKIVAHGASRGNVTKKHQPRRGGRDRIACAAPNAPPGLALFFALLTHGLRRGLLSFAPPGLKSNAPTLPSPCDNRASPTDWLRRRWCIRAWPRPI